MNNTTKPEIVEDIHLLYLDELRESGEINMFGARPYLQNEFKLNYEDSIIIHTYWMDHFKG